MICDSKKPVGIVAYGAKLPRLKISGEQIAAAQGKSIQKIYKSLGVESKTVPGIDEDVITLSTVAGFQALERLRSLDEGGVGTNKERGFISGAKKPDAREKIGALFIGSESHPYAVKPTGTVVAQALGIASDGWEGNENSGEGVVSKIKPLAMADLQFACKAGTQAMQIGLLYVNSGFCDYSMAIGADTAQAKPGDVLEYTAGAGGAAYILGSQVSRGSGNKSGFKSQGFIGWGSKNIGSKKNNSKLLAKLIATTSVATDTPDFWRRPYQAYPEHAGRFTAEPGYFAHIGMAAKLIMAETGLGVKDFDYCVFHTPNAKFPTQMAKKLGFSAEQMEASLLVKKIGNTYAGASMLGLASTLDIAEAGKKILVVSYGSGSGSDAFVFETTKYLEQARKSWQLGDSSGKDESEVNRNLSSEILRETLADQVKKLTEVSYEEYRVNSAH